jgi:hypothetical protein
MNGGSVKPLEFSNLRVVRQQESHPIGLSVFFASLDHFSPKMGSALDMGQLEICPMSRADPKNSRY